MAEAWLAIADALGHARRRRDDAQVLGARIGQDVAAAQMNLVAHQLAADVEIAAVDTAAVGDVELGEQARQHLLAGAGHRAEFAERFLVRAGINPPVGVVADAGDAYEEVDIAHDIGENKRGDVFERRQLPRADELDNPRADVAGIRGVNRVLHVIAHPQPPVANAALDARQPFQSLDPVPLAPAADGEEGFPLQYVGRKTIGVHGGGALGVGEDIEFAIGLLERLRDPERFKKRAPAQDIADAMANGMPEANRHGPPAPNNG